MIEEIHSEPSMLHTQSGIPVVAKGKEEGAGAASISKEQVSGMIRLFCVFALVCINKYFVYGRIPMMSH